MFVAMQLTVPIASAATLRLLWLVQLAKGVFSLLWPFRLTRESRVELVLLLAGGETVRLGATVRACTPTPGGFHIDLILDTLPEAQRRAMELATAMA